jgi:hypothetical protein
MVFPDNYSEEREALGSPQLRPAAILYDADSRGTVNYLNLARELIEKQETRVNA